MKRSWWLDMLERTARTFVQGFLAVITLEAFTDLSASLLDMLAIGGLAGVYAVLTAFAGGAVGNRRSASLLPARSVPPVVTEEPGTRRGEEARTYVGDEAEDELIHRGARVVHRPDGED